jgi:hypothetical protein
MSSAVLDLREQSTWDPQSLTAAALRWPTNLPLCQLQEVSDLVAPDSVVLEGAQVISPGGLDLTSGGIRRRSRTYQGSAFQISRHGPGLCVGDLLVPPSPSSPVLLVTEDMVGSVVSGAFRGLRPMPGLSLWLWAVLNSESGQTARSLLATGSSRMTLGAGLSELAVPLAAEPARLVGELAALQEATRIPEVEGRTTWWSTADLRELGWQTALATPTPEVLSQGVPLGSLCESIQRGRPVRPQEVSVVDRPNWIPIADIAFLGGKPARKWLPADAVAAIVATPGDVLVAAVGRLPHAVTATTNVVVDRNVFVVRLRHPDRAVALARYLNGTEGLGLRQILLSGAFVPSLRIADLGRLPVSMSELQRLAYAPEDVKVEPLARRLERLLWT